MTNIDPAAIAALVHQSVIADLEKRLDAEKAFLLSVLKVAGTVVGVVAVLIAWVGWSNLQGVKEQAKEEIITATENYLEKSSGVAEIEEVLDKHYTSSLVLYHSQYSIDSAHSLERGEPLSLGLADAGKLLDVICQADREEWMTISAAAVLVTATDEPWWPRFERRLGELLVPRHTTTKDDSSAACSELEPTIRAAIIHLLVPYSNRDFFSRLRPLLSSPGEDATVRAAVLDYAASIASDAVQLDHLEKYAKSDDQQVRHSALEYLARWHPQNKHLTQWVESTLRGAVGDAMSVGPAFRIVSVLFSTSSRQPDGAQGSSLDPMRRTALREMIMGEIKFVPVNPDDHFDGMHYVPFRWRRAADEFDRPVARPSRGRIERTGLERVAFEQAYAQLVNATVSLGREEGRSELTRLLGALLLSSSTPVQAEVRIESTGNPALIMGSRVVTLPQPAPNYYAIRLMNVPGTASVYDDRSLPTARFLLLPVDKTGTRLTALAPIPVSHITDRLSVHIGQRRETNE